MQKHILGGKTNFGVMFWGLDHSYLEGYL